MNICSQLLRYAGIGVFVCLVGMRGATAAGPIPLLKLQLRDPAGQAITLPPSEFTVVCFLGTECPLARLYGPRLERLKDRFGDQGVTFVGVDSNAQDSPAEIADYAKDVGLTFPIAKDADQSVLAVFDAERTPEVFVVDAAGRVRYRGRIDDQYEPGLARAKPTQHDLREAIESLLAGETVEHPQTPGVGCLITKIPHPSGKDADAATVTFTADVAPILNQHCVECHRDSEIAPFALTDYDEVVGWGQMMLEVIDQKRMPPWHADPTIGHFVGERKMPEQARDTIARWIDQGMAEGDADDLPPTPTWNSGWHLPTDPELVIPMRDRPFHVPADDVVDYQYYVVDPGWEEDRWVRAAQVVPGNARVVHHAIVFVRPPDGSDSRGIGWLGAYVPGQRTAILPPDHARRIPAGSKLIFQMHYTPNGRASDDISRVGVWFAEPADVTHEVFTRVAIDHDFEIPPRTEDYDVHISLDRFDPESRLLGVTPHMHLRGKSFQLKAQRRGGEVEDLLRVPHYDFNWQHYYQFAESLPLDEIESLDMTVTFDNSAANPANPAPEEYVTWGDQTWEEMAIAFLDVARPRHRTRTVARREEAGDVPTAQSGSSAGGQDDDRLAADQAIQSRVRKFLAAMDQDGDGRILREETPLTFQKFGFRKMDRNRDGVLDHEEVETAAAER
ncbi:redoxin domain-containing protein [Allorhodopirellula solitaria]|uniref:Thiol-disulfide oxidoreductase ResA n=1 Tax=Allorhodopirellula solitaria TaxID=2527987 RepID=A0A5C5XSP0_9BACT|nr:redoxin domain-containing protein [Allorhodopirellula solitaria]TWT64712.1 Thiol-disulfide oxidoreductase ResA [Allorhodopirellula solitaria]